MERDKDKKQKNRIRWKPNMKTLNMVKKGVVIGGVAAALLLGSTIPGFGGAAAHAAESTQVNYSAVIERQLSGLTGYVAALSNRTESEISIELQSGKTLSELSGLAGNEFYNRLVKSVEQSIDMAAQNDKGITSEQLNRIKSDAAKHITTIITTSGYDGRTNTKVDYDKIIDSQLSGLSGYAAALSNREESEVTILLQQGKSLAEVSGLGAGELAKKLTGWIDQAIDTAAQNDKTTTKEQLQKIKSDAAARVSKVVESGGYNS
jgi:hypothetical protein